MQLIFFKNIKYRYKNIVGKLLLLSNKVLYDYVYNFF